MSRENRVPKTRGILAALIRTVALVHQGCAQDSVKSGETINGYTGATFDTRGYAYDYRVDGSLAQDEPENKRFKTVEAAYAAAPAGTGRTHYSESVWQRGSEMARLDYPGQRKCFQLD